MTPRAVYCFVSCPALVLWVILGVSALALASALTAQYVFDLPPCILCLYQRIPYAAAILFALCGILFKPLRPVFIGLGALAFALNSMIAAYHVGVEQHWWASVFEGCKIQHARGDLLESLMQSPAVPCDKPAWVDPVFGGSMAVYNTLLCTGMALYCAVHLLSTRVCSQIR